MRLPHWPPRWKQRGRTIYYRTKPDDRAKFDGKHWYPLGRTEADAFAAWFRMQDGIIVPRSIREAIAVYVGSDRYLKLAPKTRREYDRAITRLRDVFGHMRPQDVIPADMYQYMKRRPATTANRERAVMLNIMQVCVEHGAITRNPIREVAQNAEEARDRYVTDAEVTAFLVHCTELLRAYVKLKLMTGIRQGQMLGLKLSDWDPVSRTLCVPGRKRGRDALYRAGCACPNCGADVPHRATRCNQCESTFTEQLDPLASAIEACTAVRKRQTVRSLNLFATRRGEQYTGDGFRCLWQYAMAKYVKAGGVRFTEHDLRAKVASDSETIDAAQDRLQHQSRTTTNRVYRRGPRAVAVLER